MLNWNVSVLYLVNLISAPTVCFWIYFWKILFLKFPIYKSIVYSNSCKNIDWYFFIKTNCYDWSALLFLIFFIHPERNGLLSKTVRSLVCGIEWQTRETLSSALLLRYVSRILICLFHRLSNSSVFLLSVYRSGRRIYTKPAGSQMAFSANSNKSCKRLTYYLPGYISCVYSWHNGDTGSVVESCFQ